MGRLSSQRWWWTVAILSASIVSGCGHHRATGVPSAPARITLSPGGTISVQLGSAFIFTASAQTSTNRTVATTFTYASTDTSILNVSPTGVACAGTWDATYATCNPGGIGVVQVTASALGSTSVPTFVFVHPAIDNITVTGILANGAPIQEPCLSQGQSMTVEAHAFSQGSDITASVGPFTWSANNSNVVTLTPIVNLAYDFATNQATAAAATPGITQIFASASNVSSTSFQQPQLLDQNNNPIPVVFDFFETCPIQNITLELGTAASGQTSFVTSKGTSETVIATVTDVMGNTSLPNTNGGIVLSKIPLTWSASQPGVIAAGTSCVQSCALTTPSAGAGAVTASCSPPTCNVGFPLAPAVLSSDLSSPCAKFMQSQFPTVPNLACQQFIPVPVYSSPPPSPQPPPVPPPPPTTAAISGVVTGAISTATVLATSLGCASESPVNCTTSIYSIATSKATAGVENPMPVSPNSLLFDLAGDKVYVGNDFGAQLMNPANFGGTTSAFTPLGTVTGKILAVSPNGSLAAFSDTLHVPNQVYVVNATAGTTNSSIGTALNIYGASTAAFSPDGLKAFIFGFDSNGNTHLYIYSFLQSLQVPPQSPLPAGTTANSIAFSTNGAFAYVVEPMLGGVGPAVSVYNTCDNAPITDTTTGKSYIPLAASPIAFKALPDGIHFIALEEGGNIDYISAKITGIPAATLTQPATSLCPMTVGHTVQTFNLGQGDIHPINFFVSADGTVLYIVASDRSSILEYSLSTNTVSGILLAGNATPVSADISVDGGTIAVAASDGLLHQISTIAGGSDQAQIPFPNLPNFLNPFCTINPPSGPCTLDFVGVKP